MTSTQITVQDNSEFDPNLLTELGSYLPRILNDNGLPDLTPVLLEPVNNYHKSTAYVYFNRKTQLPQAVVKVLNNKNWDNQIDMIQKENQIGVYVEEKIPTIKSRKMKIYQSQDENPTGIVYYEYLGQAQTNLSNTEEIIDLSIEVFELLSLLHFTTISTVPGYSIDEVKRRKENHEVAKLTCKYLLQDVKRENLDPDHEIERIIYEKWFPVFNQQTLFSLTHRDITLSNIIRMSNGGITFIDWTYSAWTDPTYDIANMVFWTIKTGTNKNLIMKQIIELSNLYKKKGFYIEQTFPYFLARKFIDFGRFRGKEYVEIGRKLLGIQDLETLISSAFLT
jgi:hypothetical protein